MTMLDRMRRHKAWLKWSLAFVCATFVLLYVPQFLDPTGTGTGTGAAAGDVVATIEGRRITASTYQQIYNQQMAQVRASYGEMSEQVARQMGIPQRVIQQLVSQEAQIAEAERLGLTVTDGELRERIVRIPAFQENGVFVGDARYTEILATARPPLRPAAFEADFRRSLLAEKLQAAVTGWVRVSDADVEQAYRREHERVRLDLAIFDATQFRAGIQPTDAEITAAYTANPETYRVEEKRRVRYLSVDAAALQTKVTITPQEVEARYRDNMASFSTPEQTRASHILFATAGKDEAAVRKTAEEVLARVQKGEDFAALAKQFSDDGSKEMGGDLDFNARGIMVPEFDAAMWALQPGQTSAELVKTQFGFHIIRVTDRRAAVNRTLDEVRPQLENQIRTEKARAEASRLSAELEGQIATPADLDKVAAQHGLTVGDSGLFARQEPLAGLGPAPLVATEAFGLEQDKVAGPLQTMQGYAFIALVEIKPSYVPAIEEVRDDVREDVIQAKAVEVARARAASLASSTANFAAAAKAAGAPVRSTELITRGTALPDVGVSDRIDAAAFALKAGERSQPIATDSAVVVVHLRERQDIVPEGLEAQRETVRAQLTNQRRMEFFSAYMAKAMEGMDISYNEATLTALLGQ
jgi:peptidyl-prolyl cis-trans isomerase D